MTNGRVSPAVPQPRGKKAPAVLPAAWNSVAINRLPFVLLKIQVNRTALAMVSSRNHGKEFVLPATKNFGTCQAAQISPRTRLDVNALQRVCNRGSA